jgi:DNA-binding NarL/FixJ family response regulator
LTIIRRAEISMASKFDEDKLINKAMSKSRMNSSALARGALNANLSRHQVSDRPPASEHSAQCSSGGSECGRGDRICLARATCETPPSGSDPGVDCNLKTVAIIDDHPLFRAGVSKALMEASCFDVIAEGESKDDAIAIAQRQLPDLMILDVNIPGGGIEAAIGIGKVSPNIRTLFLTASDEESDVLSCIQAGALGYILKSISGSDLVNMARSVSRGETIITPSLAGRLLTSMHKRNEAKMSKGLKNDLTPREEEILELVTRGNTNKEVARALDVSEKTVKHYMTNIMLKLGVRNRVEATLSRGPAQDRLRRT